MSNPTATPWLSYWQTLPPGRLLFHPEGEAFAHNFRQAIRPAATDRLLDYGCGFGHVAGLLAPHVGEVRVWDAAPAMCDRAAANLSQFPNVRPWDETERDFNLILVNSVVQYLSPGELTRNLRRWEQLLAVGGRLILSDVSEPGHSVLSDMWSLFRFSVRRGYFLSAVWNTLAERRRYNATAQSCPLYHPAKADLELFAAAAGLTVRYLPHNLTHFAGRYTAVLTRTPHAPRHREH
ncbi:class I SAM-dependent methyltransferase [Limnoglobus roseus]|uniref:Trans-aconitate 2-methyltransferase n=1 Tax=Limnoglobus roseus TaxID=2598579 RepID=A0A5C1ABA1_9BACT|nr:class I SAM-dependent methyltransferase [Limnoglobus roseus]QEL15296.1 Trans-aconitate 2-methyltransferase [Limnoglobus roseus]